MPRHRLLLTVAFSLGLGSSALGAEPEPVPGPDKPLQTRPTKVDDSQILQGWTANIGGVSGEGKTLLVVSGEDGYLAIATIDGAPYERPHPATFELADKDHRILLKVRDARGAEWSETVDVPKGMKVTVDIKARYEHRGFEGTIKNDTLACRGKGKPRHLRFEIWKDGAMLGNPILLEPGKSAPGVRLKPGPYELRIFEKQGADYKPRKTVTLDPKEPLWRYDEGCE